MSPIRVALATTAVLALTGALGAAAFIWIGVYDVGATRQHTQAVFSLLETAMHRSVRLRAAGVVVPPLNDEQMVLRGAACFHDKCVQCHGAPGVSQGDIGKSMQPLPGPLVDAPQNWRAAELYWITKHGIRLSGMPAWEFRLTDAQLWDVVAFMQRLPDLTPQAYAEATAWREKATTVNPAAPAALRAGRGDAVPACGRSLDDAPQRMPDAVRGKQALYQYACSACHTIPGVTGSFPYVGPPLTGMGGRALIAGRLANTPENMMLWLRHPQQVDPLTAMPDLGVTPEHAADMAAYLSSLR